MTFLLQFLILAFIVVSAGLAIAVPVVYATASDDGEIRGFVELGGAVWAAMLILVAALSLLVI